MAAVPGAVPGAAAVAVVAVAVVAVAGKVREKPRGEREVSSVTTRAGGERRSRQ